MSFKDAFPEKVSPAITDSDTLKALDEKIKGGNVVIAMANEIFQDDIAELKAKLDSRNIRLGDIIGIGSMGGVTYEVLDTGGKLMNVVLRVDPTDLVTTLEPPSPARIRPVLKETAGYFSASIVPKAKRVQFSKEEFEKSLAVINTDGHLGHLHDLTPEQFMKIEGINVAVLTDLSCVSADGNPLNGTGTLEEFISKMGMDAASVQSTRIPLAEMTELREGQEAIHTKAVKELEAAGVFLGEVPTQQVSSKLTRATDVAVQAGKH